MDADNADDRGIAAGAAEGREGGAPMIGYLHFRGTISDGTGRFSQLVIPGPADVFDAPVDWPAMLTPGTLSVRITPC